MPPGFKREELRARYDVPSIVEDDWYAYCGQKTANIVKQYLGGPSAPSALLLNAGCGVYQLSMDSWKEVSVDRNTRASRKSSMPWLNASAPAAGWSCTPDSSARVGGRMAVI
jgi:hypothetical protein